MKLGGISGTYAKPLMIAMQNAGFVVKRRSTSHIIFGAPGKPKVTLPQRLDDPHLAKRLAKIAGVELG